MHDVHDDMYEYLDMISEVEILFDIRYYRRGAHTTNFLQLIAQNSVHLFCGRSPNYAIGIMYRKNFPIMRRKKKSR